jgi:hypothetical protein
VTRYASAKQSSPLARCAAGIAGGLLASVAMNMFARAVTAARGREADGAAPGAERHGRGVQPPQADGAAHDDAAVRVGATAYRAVTGREPDRDMYPWLGSAAHYAFGAAAGALYGLADRRSWLRTGYGTLYGGLVWAVVDEGLTPAFGLSRGPRQLPAGVLLYGLCGHLVYGSTLDCVTRTIAA